MKSSNPPQEAVDHELLLAQLEIIVASASFRTSRRASRFLRFIVEQTLCGHGEELKERILGVQVFDRPHDYDLTSDPIVRVAACDLRKRLAQYYVGEGQNDAWRIELLPGSYMPHFTPSKRVNAYISAEPETHEPQLPNEASSMDDIDQQPSSAKLPASLRWLGRRGWMFVACALILIVVAMGEVAWIQSRSARALDAFWLPIRGRSSSMLFCIAGRGPFDKPIDSDEGMDLTQFMQHHNRLGPYDVLSLARLIGFADARDHRFSVMLADSVTLTDLRHQPAVLIGAFNNQWTDQLNQGGRFQFYRGLDGYTFGIVDRRRPATPKWLLDFRTPQNAIHQDYGMITRRASPLTGQQELIVAGIGPYGTLAATEFATSLAYFDQFSRKANSGWEHKNIQIIVGTDVVNGRSGPPHMLAFDLQ